MTHGAGPRVSVLTRNREIIRTRLYPALGQQLAYRLHDAVENAPVGLPVAYGIGHRGLDTAGAVGRVHPA